MRPNEHRLFSMSASYRGAVPLMHRNTCRSILTSMRRLKMLGSQCRCSAWCGHECDTGRAHNRSFQNTALLCYCTTWHTKLFIKITRPSGVLNNICQGTCWPRHNKPGAAVCLHNRTQTLSNKRNITLRNTRKYGNWPNSQSNNIRLRMTLLDPHRLVNHGKRNRQIRLIMPTNTAGPKFN